MTRFGLGPLARQAGYRIEGHDSIGSTNTEALARASAGDPGRLWVAALEQTAGRGRRGRAWASPGGNLAASLLVTSAVAPPLAATLGFVAGVALGEALRCVLPEARVRVGLDGAEGPGPAPAPRFTLKWPNDVLADGAKLAGILLEAEPLPLGRTAVAVGIGVNVVAAPDGLAYPATCLHALGVDVGAEALAEALAERWVPLYDEWDEGRGLARTRARWLEQAAGLGGEVAVRQGERVVRGVFETIDADGRLVVRARDGSAIAIAAGDVHFGATATAG